MPAPIFVVSWADADKRQQIVASFTEALSTFTGTPVVRVQMTSNGDLVSGGTLTKALSSLFAAGQKEIFKRKWIPGLTSADEVSPFLRIHSVREPIIASTLQEMGGSPRLLGSCQMMPAVVKFDEISTERLGIKLPASTPFDVLVHPAEIENYFPKARSTAKGIAAIVPSAL